MPPNPPDRRLSRRGFAGAVAAGALAISSPLPPAQAAGPITEVVFDLMGITKWDESNGDTWDPFWADDGQLYAFNCDGRGFGPRAMNLAFNRLSGDRANALSGTPVNPMEEYGISGEQKERATWKACGQECIDSVFYAFVSRNVYGGLSGDPLMRQTAAGSSLIKSTDRGVSWTRGEPANYRAPMWPGPRFGAPFFIHYGRNGGQVSRDRAREYVYAVSTNGFWNDGDAYILGRVRRGKLPALDPADWEYHRGGDGNRDRAWTDNVAGAVPILKLPARCGQSGPCFIPALHTYVLISWYNTATLTHWFEPNEVRYDFYQAPHPWGPWSIVSSLSDDFLPPGSHMYGPSLCSKFQTFDGATVSLPLFTSGCPFEDKPTGIYKLWMVPVLLKTAAPSRFEFVTGDDPRILVSGPWESRDHVRYGTGPDSAAEFSFTGTGIDYVAGRDSEYGGVDVYLDGAVSRNVTLRLDNFPRISRAAAFSARGLTAGNHVIKLVNKSASPICLEGFRIYSKIA